MFGLKDLSVQICKCANSQRSAPVFSTSNDRATNIGTGTDCWILVVYTFAHLHTREKCLGVWVFELARNGTPETKGTSVTFGLSCCSGSSGRFGRLTCPGGPRRASSSRILDL